MCYSEGHPVRLIGGRLALDFVNTADWTADGHIAHEKLRSLADLTLWLEAVNLDSKPLDSLANLIRYRASLRQILLSGGDPSSLNAVQALCFEDASSDPITRRQPLQALLAASAVSLLADSREHERIKMCPGENCGWLFIDETKNGRRTWCSMESCGNRAKAARHYARKKNRAPARV
ncbi:CGNR zinc finger domain-containing protein [Labrenzia sp. THAF82]|uniref:CGNR zinc finger domain-containing protein n=1 Tax=Labrenzia sp. THAF82 TaxID=2587861 RepID=UPI0012689074|nr:CGNR zinc finger domain-containing protein [Labrenzia sp. THAF82]